MSITDFLLRRIEEDENRANYYGSLALGTARVLAECAAKRAIIELRDTYAHSAQEAVGIAFVGARGGQQVVEEVLRAVAAVYKDHPDYRQEWEPNRG